MHEKVLLWESAGYRLLITPVLRFTPEFLITSIMVLFTYLGICQIHNNPFIDYSWLYVYLRNSYPLPIGYLEFLSKNIVFTYQNILVANFISQLTRCIVIQVTETWGVLESSAHCFSRKKEKWAIYLHPQATSGIFFLHKPYKLLSFILTACCQSESNLPCYEKLKAMGECWNNWMESYLVGWR